MMKKLIQQLTPFLAAGVFIVALTFGLMLLAYLLVFGAILGSVLFLFNWVRDKFAPKKKTSANPRKQPSGRIIDSNDWREL